MTTLRIAVALLLASSASVLLAQKPVPAINPVQPAPSEPLVAEVRVSPYRTSINFTVNPDTAAPHRTLWTAVTGSQ